MHFNNSKEAIDFLETVEIYVSSEDDILMPKKKLFEDDVHNAIDYLIDECGFGIKYI
jgi:hypothetical protein